MKKYREYKGKIVLSYETRSEQLAIDALFDLLDAMSVEDALQRLCGFDSYEAAEASPGWGAAREKGSDGETQSDSP